VAVTSLNPLIPPILQCHDPRQWKCNGDILTSLGSLRLITSVPAHLYPWLVVSVKLGSVQSQSVQLLQLTLPDATVSTVGTAQITTLIWIRIHDWLEFQYNDPFTS